MPSILEKEYHLIFYLIMHLKKLSDPETSWKRGENLAVIFKRKASCSYRTASSKPNFSLKIAEERSRAH